ncbi:serine hydrolase domain-containing protein [Planctomycetota bacterium]
MCYFSIYVALLGIDLSVVNAASVSLASGRGQGTTERTRFSAMTEAIKAEMTELGISGAAVAVLEGGEITFAQGFGSKHPDYHDPVLASTLFRIGSVTKMLTTVGLLQQVDRDVVDLWAPITDYLPGVSFPFEVYNDTPINVRDLLTHRSAIVDYIEIDPPGFQDDGALARYFTDVYPDSPGAYVMAPAGRMWNYTNVGYMLAGLISEMVTGSYYHEYLQDSVLRPLDMNRTFFLPEDVLADGDFAYGSALHWETGEPLIVEPNTYDNGWARPAGYAFSSVLDLAEMVKFMRNGHPDVLSEALHAAMQAPQVDMEVFLDLVHYGYGFIVQEAGFYRPGTMDFFRLRVVSHGGDIYGYSADLYYVPSLDFGFIVLTNAGFSHLNISFSTALSTLCELPAPEPLPDLSMSAADYVNYRGYYQDAYDVGDVWVRGSGSQLQVEIPGFLDSGLRYQSTLVANTPHNFLLFIEGLAAFDRFPMQVTFILDEEGRSEYFRTRGFVAHFKSKDIGTPTDRPGRRILSLAARSPMLDHPDVLPVPPLPFIQPVPFK